jgi:hypothetical protein
VWDDVLASAQQFSPRIVGKRDADGNDMASQGLAQAGGGGPTLTIDTVVASSDFCAAWLIDSNYLAVRLSHLRQEGCAAHGEGLFRFEHRPEVWMRLSTPISSQQSLIEFAVHATSMKPLFVKLPESSPAVFLF